MAFICYCSSLDRMTPEHRIMNQIRLWCGQHDILCFRCNVGRVRTADGGWFDTGLPEGFSDLLILHNGQCIFCEVKTPNGRQHDCQIAFEQTVRSRGFIYIVARSVEDVKKLF